MRAWSVVVAVAAGCGDDGTLPPIEASECRFDADCTAPHSACIDHETTQTCECVAGYAPGATGCVWVGVVADAELTATDVWNPFFGASLDPSFADGGHVGAAHFAKLACGALLQQRVVMPRYALAEPLVAVSRLRITPGETGFPELAFGLGGVWNDRGNSLFTADWLDTRLCLGAAHYAPDESTGRGLELQLELGITDPTTCTFHPSGLDIDRFDIVPANPGECPIVGPLGNGSADTDDDWSFAAQPPATATFEEGIGDGGSRAVRLFEPTHCEFAAAGLRAAIPIAIAANPAISFYARTSANTRVHAGVNGRSLAFADAGEHRVRACLPATFRGLPLTLGFDALHLDGQGCPDPTVVDREAVIDSVVLYNDERCGTDPRIADPGFESGFASLAFAFANANADVVEDPAQAHSGQRVLRMRNTGCPALAQLDVSVVTPSYDATAGPAVTFWQRSTPRARTRFVVNGPTVPTDASWQKTTVCLRPRPGRSATIRFELEPIVCDGTPFDETVFVDDLEATRDPSCPN